MRLITKFIRVSPVAFLAAALASSVPQGSAHAFDKLVVLGTSSTSGVYYPVGEAICRLINADRPNHLMRCLPYSTGGSVYNIQALASGELDLAITRSDLVYDAYNGKGQFATMGANRGLRTITNLYGQPVAVIVKADSGITGFEQLEGRSINIGNRGSGKREIANLIFKIMGWTAARFSKVTELSTGAMGEAFCAGKVDVLIESLGIPAPFYDRINRECGGKFLSLPDDLVAGFKKVGPFFYDDKIVGNLYPHNPNDVKTVGIKVVLVTIERVTARSTGIVAASIFDQLAKFRSSHSALARSNVSNMLKQGIHVPIHSGARAYYVSKGLLK